MGWIKTLNPTQALQKCYVRVDLCCLSKKYTNLIFFVKHIEYAESELHFDFVLCKHIVKKNMLKFKIIVETYFQRYIGLSGTLISSMICHNMR